MKSATEQILKQAVNLPPIERAELLERIIESFDPEPNDEIRTAWAEEAERRLSLHRKDPSASLSEEEVFVYIEKIGKK